MKEHYNPQAMANPTMKTQERVLKIIKVSKSPMTISELARQSKLNFYQVKTSINYLKRLGIVNIIVSSGNITLVQLNKPMIQNATAN